MQRSFKSTKIACYIGYFVQAIINNLSPILFIIFSSELHISLNQIGSLILINFLAQAVVDVISVKTVDKVGYKKIILISHACAFLGLIFLGILPKVFSTVPFPFLVFSTIISAMGSGMIEVTVSPIVDSIPSEKKAADMSLLHSFYCWGQMAVVALSTIFIRIFGSTYWYILPLLWAFVPCINLLNFMTVPFMPTLKANEKTPLKNLFRSFPFLIALLLMLCSGASELAMSQWSSYFAEAGLGVSKMTGDLLGPCMFALLMGCGRLFFGLHGHKLDLKKSMIFCAVLCIVCYAITGLSAKPLLSLFACAVSGLSVSLFWPGTFSLVSEQFPKGGASMFGVLAFMGDMGCSTGPFLVSLVSSSMQAQNSLLSNGQALKYGLFFGTLFPLFMLLGLFFLLHSSKKSVDK